MTMPVPRFLISTPPVVVVVVLAVIDSGDVALAVCALAMVALLAGRGCLEIAENHLRSKP